MVWRVSYNDSEYVNMTIISRGRYPYVLGRNLQKFILISYVFMELVINEYNYANMSLTRKQDFWVLLMFVCTTYYSAMVCRGATVSPRKLMK